MAKAESLFKRHWKEYCQGSEHFNPVQNLQRAIIYQGCIIAEAIRTEMDEAEIKDPKEGDNG